MFIADAMTALDERALYIAMGEEGSTISRIERPEADGTRSFRLAIRSALSAAC
jgi:hypothetical protein